MPEVETMEERERIRRTPDRTAQDDAPTIDDQVTSGEQGERIKAELDDLLDEIDEVLETNAEDFVRSFVQKGGE